MRIKEEYNKTGYFWLPGQDENKIPGILSISDGGEAELEIVGHFDESAGFLNDNFNVDRILGLVEKDGLVTLENCIYTSKNSVFGGISKSKLRASLVLSGATWDKHEDVTFNTFSFSVDCLDEWIGISGIKVDENQENKTVEISYQLPEEKAFLLDNGMKLLICFAYTPPGFPNLTGAKISQRAYFRLESEMLLDLKQFIKISHKITTLMCFAIDNIVAIKNVSATSSKILRDLGNGEQYCAPISIYYESIPYTEKTPKNNHFQMLFTFRSIKENAEQVFNNWLNAYEYLSPALGLYFSTLTGAHKYLDSKFLALAQGLETYHRRTSNETLWKPEIYNSLVSQIMEGCPEKYVEWLQGRLAHGNEINLGKRIKKIIEPFKGHLGTSDQRNKLLYKIVTTRNYLTHYNESLKEGAAQGRELWLLCLKMEAIFNLHFFKVIGFTEQEISEVVKVGNPLNRKLNQN